MYKKVLIICPKFFGYDELIKSEFNKLGFCADLVDDRPQLGVIGKGVLRLFPVLLKWKINKYFKKEILKKIKENKYDAVFFILGQSFFAQQIKEIKNISPNAKVIYYTRDSIENFPNTLEIANECDHKYSFDMIDCKKYGFDYLPLFYNVTSFDENDKQYFANFIGTVKRGKYAYLKSIREQFDNEAKKKGKQNFFYLYLQSKLVFVFYKIFYKEFRHAKMSEFKFKKLPYEETLNIQFRSEITIDVAMANQNGLTMRTFESLALRSKLFTTNKFVKSSDFYDEKYIYVYNNENIDFENDFFKSKYDSNIVEKYSLESWVKTITKVI